MGASSTLRFLLATRDHEPGIRRLLRESPMRGTTVVSLRREPDHFAACRIDGPRTYTIVALDDHDAVVCMGCLAIRDRFYNGEPRPVGYLGQLRLARSHAGRFDLLRRGYAFMGSLLHTLLNGVTPLPMFTSIAADNARAIRVLERGLRGMPTYRHVGDLVTVLIDARSARRGRSTDRAATVDAARLAAVIEFVNQQHRAFQFGPVWTMEEIDTFGRSFDLDVGRFRIVEGNGHLAACGAIWDQRPFKQAVVTRYSGVLGVIRPAFNAACVFAGRARLPKVGQPVDQAFVAYAVGPKQGLSHIIHSLATAARDGSVDWLTLGFDSRDERLAAVVREFRCRQYRTRLYSVSWPDLSDVEPPDGRLMQPEVATL